MINTLRMPDIMEMVNEGWVLWGVAPRSRCIADQDKLPPWVHWFYAPAYSDGAVEQWIKE